MPRSKQPQTPPQPAPPPDPGDLPHPLTIFLNARDHRAAIDALRRLHTDRAEALRRALRLKPQRAGGDA